jgi:hypothetical protein
VIEETEEIIKEAEKLNKAEEKKLSNAVSKNVNAAWMLREHILNGELSPQKFLQIVEEQQELRRQMQEV